MTISKNRCTLQTNDSFLEIQKNRLLLALYEQNYAKAHKLFDNTLKNINSIVTLDENSEKLLNQTHLIVKKFSWKIPEPISIKFIKNNKYLKNFITSSIKQSSRNINHVALKTWEETICLNQIQMGLVYKTAMTFQLTTGCSNFCRRCNEWAIPKIRSHFSFNAIKQILLFMREQKNDGISLFGASDPLDWNENLKKNIADIIKYLKKISLQYNILTKVPKGKENLLKALLKSECNLSVSITSKNKKRIREIEESIKTPISKQHDLDELLIPAGLDEDFVSIKPSITDGYGTEITPDGAFIIIPTFTTALHPYGHKKIPITKETNFFPIKKTGRDALLIDYFKPLKGYNLENQIVYLDHLLDVQVESIILDNGEDELTPPGMRSLKEYFEIFEEKPRLQRKKMTRTVLKHLKKQFFFNSSFKNLSKKKRGLYLKKIKSHLDLCDRDECFKAKIFAASFFLESVSMYISVNPLKGRIMQSLLKERIQHFDLTIASLTLQNHPEKLFSNYNDIFFDIFQYYIFQLLDNPDNLENTNNLENPGNSNILQFIKTYPSKYDPDADIFISRIVSG